MFVLTFILFITLSMRGSVVLYYFKYFVSGDAVAAVVATLPPFLVNVLGSTDAVTLAFSVFNVLGTTATIIGIFFSKRLAMRFGKRDVFKYGLMGTALFTAVFFVLPPAAVTLMFAAEILRQFVYGFTIPLLWAMMADVADYSEWKNRRRATAIVFAAIVFALKAGLGFGGAITGYVLSIFGYVPNVAQTARALEGIRYTMSIFPAVTFAICAACLFFYGIDKAAEIRITDDLTERRKAFATGEGAR
jgi:glycoside/pentoside/hexuronide:cation symporter, GPH family